MRLDSFASDEEITDPEVHAIWDVLGCGKEDFDRARCHSTAEESAGVVMRWWWEHGSHGVGPLLDSG